MKKVAVTVLSAALAIAPQARVVAEELSLEGKTIGMTVIGTSHHWDFMAYRGQIETIERLGGRVIALDAHHDDQTQITHIRELITKRPHAIIEQLGNIHMLEPWLKRIRDAGIPLFTVDTVTEHAINNTTSNNYGIGSDIALQMVQDMGGEGKVLIFTRSARRGHRSRAHPSRQRHSAARNSRIALFTASTCCQCAKWLELSIRSSFAPGINAARLLVWASSMASS